MIQQAACWKRFQMRRKPGYEDQEENPNYDTLDYEGSFHHHIMTIIIPLIDIVTIMVVDNWDSNGSEREDSNPTSREVTTREVKAEVVLLHYHSFLVPLQCIGHILQTNNGGVRRFPFRW